MHRGGLFQARPGFVSAGSVALALGALLLSPASPLSLSVGACGTGAASGRLADSIDFLESGAASRAHFGILAVSLDRGDTLLAFHPDRRFVPASNMKLFVTGAFLKQYGPAARGTTEIGARGRLDRKHGGREVNLKGDLVLRGSGYPDVYQLLRPGSRGLLDSLAFLLHQSGLRKFEGVLWVDGSLFAREPFGIGWAVDDLPWSYGAPLNAILANGNGATLLATATPQGVSLSLDPPETPLRVEGTVALGDSGSPADLSIARDPGSSLLRVNGRIPRGGTVRKQVAVPNPDSTAGLVLLGSMKRLGIEVRGSVSIGAPPGSPSGAPSTAGAGGFARVGKKEFQSVIRLDSPPAADIVSMIEPYSLNVETEALLRLLDPAPAGKSAAGGLRRLLAILSEAGVDTSDVSFVDGSGLSPLDLATPRALVGWLAYLDRDPALGRTFRESLAAPGGVGTLRRRFQGLDSSGTLRAKTGTLTNVSALSGYMTSAGGERIAFSILSNGNRGSVASARAAEEMIVGLLARQRRPAAEEAPTPRMIPR